MTVAEKPKVLPPPPGSGTRYLGVLGHPVRHSYSPAIMNAAFEHLGLDWRYGAYEVPPARFAAALEGLRALGFVGANITVPHKEAATLACDELSPEAELAGAVNTVMLRGGRLFGHNTDAGGFVAAVREELGFESVGAEVVVLGAGGSARAVIVGLARAGAARIVVINRTLPRAEAVCSALSPNLAARLEAAAWDEPSLAAALARAKLVVDCTVVGLSDEGGSTGFAGRGGVAPLKASEPPLPSRVPLEALAADAVVATLVYHRETKLLTDARARGLRGADGRLMLLHQAALSLALWTGGDPPLEVMRAAFDRAR